MDKWDPREILFEFRRVETVDLVTTIWFYLRLSRHDYDWEDVSLICDQRTGQVRLQLPLGGSMPVAPARFWDGIATQIRDHAIREGLLIVRGAEGTIIDAVLVQMVERLERRTRDCLRVGGNVQTEILLNQIIHRWPDGSHVVVTVSRKDAPNDGKPAARTESKADNLRRGRARLHSNGRARSGDQHRPGGPQTDRISEAGSE